MQYDLPFFEDEPFRPRRPERLFLALFPSLEDKRRIGAFRQRLVSTDDRLLPEWRFHLSLFALGDFWHLPTKRIFAAMRAAAAVFSPSIAAELAAITSFDNGKPRRPLVLLARGDGLYDLHHDLGAALRKNGLRAYDHFTPHVTLSYGPTVVAEQMIEPIDLRLSEFALIHSRRGLGEYRLLGRWPLLG